MNKVILIGRLTRNPDVRHSQGEKPITIARYTLAVKRRIQKEGEPSVDFIPCVTFGRQAEHAEQYYKKGLKISVCGRIQSGSYVNSEGTKVYTVEVVVEEQEFAESKKDQQSTINDMDDPPFK